MGGYVSAVWWGAYNDCPPIALRFPGQWFQLESALHQNWMRDYDPTTGRYMQADPLGLVDGASVYGYALQNPGRYTDPTGELIPVIAAVVGRAAIGAIAGGVGAYVNSNGCMDAVLIGAASGAAAGVIFANPSAVSSVGTLLGGVAGSAGGQLGASLLDACSCQGISFPNNFDEATKRASVNVGLAVASGFGAAIPGAMIRTGIVHGGVSTGFGSAVESVGIGVVEGLGAGGSEFLYNRATR